jgi:hypothetical protein
LGWRLPTTFDGLVGRLPFLTIILLIIGCPDDSQNKKILLARRLPLTSKMSSPYGCATSRLILGVVGKFMGVVFPSPFKIPEPYFLSFFFSNFFFRLKFPSRNSPTAVPPQGEQPWMTQLTFANGGGQVRTQLTHTQCGAPDIIHLICLASR